MDELGQKNFKFSLDEFKANLTPQEIIDIIKIFEPDLYYEETDSYLLLPTICHNLHQEDGSLKLYYYFNTKLFFCYTHCGASFDIFELIKKMLALRGEENNFSEILKVITSKKNMFFINNGEQYSSIFNKFKRKNQEAKYKEFSPNVLASFQKIYSSDWISEGITIESMEKYGIKYSIAKEQIIIPHYDINGKLIGIRARNLNPLSIEKGKYMPAYVEGTLYAHPLSYNLYGINFCKEAISRKKKAIIVEGEKSSLLGDGWYKEDNVIVASCGKKLNKFQINLLIKLGVKDLTICYDRMNYDSKTDESYFKELYDICKKYSNYMNMSFVFDREHILEYKAAPLDSGKEVFEKLIMNKVVV